MAAMFYKASSFNQPLDTWDVGQVTNMRFMFGEALSFNQPLPTWMVQHGASRDNLFLGVTALQNVGPADG